MRAKDAAFDVACIDLRDRPGRFLDVSPRGKEEARSAAAPRADRLECAVAAERGDDGPYFSGDRLCLVDAACAPFLQCFASVERTLRAGPPDDFPPVRGGWDALAADPARCGALAAVPGPAAAAAE